MDRQLVINQLNEFLNNDKSKELECSIYDYCNELVNKYDIHENFDEIYLHKYNDVIKNINPNDEIKNNYLLDAILNNQIEIDEIVNLTPEKMFPEKWKKIRDKIEWIEYKKKNMATTDIFFCKKCKKKKCTFYQLQTRSADEPMTTFVNCLVCHNSWKF